jgi:hypothetical protein
MTYSVAYTRTRGIRNDIEEPGLLQLRREREHVKKCLQHNAVRINLKNIGQKCQKQVVLTAHQSRREAGPDVP